jgi:hypothetical protein
MSRRAFLVWCSLGLACLAGWIGWWRETAPRPGDPLSQALLAALTR